MYTCACLTYVAALFVLRCSPAIAGLTTEEPISQTHGPLFLVEPPNSIVFANTRGASVSCSAFGRPSPAMGWIRADGTPVGNVSGVLRILPNNTLHFLPFTDDNFMASAHLQEYRCVASNKNGRIISRPLRVTAVLVNTYKTYNVRLNDVWVMRGGTAILKCQIDPRFVNKYIKVTEWNQTPPTPERISIMADGRLQVRDVQDSDKYITYQCVTKNILTGETKKSPSAYLHVYESPAVGSSPNFDNSVTTVTVREGESTELPCVAAGYPLPSYHWTKDGAEISVTGDQYSLMGGNLVVYNLSVAAADGGDYKCTARNKHGSASVTVTLVVTSSLAATIYPSDQVVDAGHMAIFNCSVLGSPVKEIIWYHNGEFLSNNTRLQQESNTWLQISDVSRRDQGMYQCIVGNDREFAQATGQLLLGAAHPALMEAFQELFIQPGLRLSLKCIISGNPTPTVSWTLDDEVIKLNSRIDSSTWVTNNGDVISYLNITNIHIQDGGEYCCKGTNEVGHVSHMARVNVYGAPFIRVMKNITATASEPLNLRCFVSGYPIASVSWSKGGQILPINHRQRVDHGELNVNNVQKNADDGEYTCTAVNLDSQGMNRNVWVHIIEPPIITPFTFQKRTIQGQRVMVICVVSSGDLPITIRWFKDGQLITANHGVAVHKSGSYTSVLSIDNVIPAHDGNYTCFANNSAKGVNYTASLHVLVPQQWVVEPQNSFVVLQKSTKIDCQTSGVPEPVVKWQRAQGSTPGNYIDLLYSIEGSRVKNRLHLLSNGTLIISDAKESDMGYYLCRASNGISSELSKVVLLTVHIPARFEQPYKNYTVKKDENATLECSALGDKPIYMMWNFNGESLNVQMNPKMDITTEDTENGKISRLAISSAVREDTGSYMCNAKNQFGIGVTTLKLIVVEVPESPLNLRMAEGNSTSFSVVWDEPYDGNNEITMYSVQFKNASDQWQGVLANMTVFPADLLTAEIRNLHPAYFYHVRVLAINSIGQGVPTHPITVQTREEAPSAAPTNVRVQASGSTSLKVTWQPPPVEFRNGRITGYLIGYKIYNSSSPYLYVNKVVENTSDLEVRVKNLQKFTRYAIHVQAYNVMGSGPKTEDMTVFTLEDVPSLPPADVRAKAMSPQTIHVVWSEPPFYTLHGVLQGYKVLYKSVRLDEDESDANFVTTSKFQVMLHNLEKYTNYSIQVLAFTRMGEGVRSHPVYIRTMEDAPGKPADAKAFAVNRSCILVSWRPPLQINGVLKKYTILYKNSSDSLPLKTAIDVPLNVSHHIICHLQSNQEYEVAVSASTGKGPGDLSKIVRATCTDKAPARIINFSEQKMLQWQKMAILSCRAVGNPSPVTSWKVRHKPLIPSSMVHVLKSGDLKFDRILSTDAANYTCMATNKYGTDGIIISVTIRVKDFKASPPKPPVCAIVSRTGSTIQMNWRSGSNGGSLLKGFYLKYKKEHGEWQTLKIKPKVRTYTITGLKCGTGYRFVLNAFNDIGTSPDSIPLSAKTNGSSPVMPPQNLLLQEVNTTSVKLDLTTWISSGCSIKFYAVKYRLWGDVTWVVVSNHLNGNKTSFTVQDLRPATWYVMKVVAHNEAGSTETTLKFGTLTYTGSTIMPLFVVHRKEGKFYEKIYVMLPLCTGIVVILVAVVAILLWSRQRNERLRFKETASNLRRDITAETSLMNDLDKRLNLDLDSGGGTPAMFGKRNVNLLVSLQSDDNIRGNSPSWFIHNNGSKTTSDNGSLSRSDDDANPYATINQLSIAIQACKPPLSSTQPTSQSSDEDSVALEKSAAQRQARGPPVQARILPARVDNQTLSNTVQGKEGYENKGVVLSPRRYASADHIHALFTSVPSRSESSYSKSKQGSGGSSSEKGSQRHSVISSVTTVSSSRDELLEAYENAKRNPPPPVVYESHPDSSSQPTDSSSATEPGICQFTQSPPDPDEHREASFEVPAHEHRRRRKHVDVESDTTECEIVRTKDRSPPRRSRGRHKGKQKGQVVSKRQLGVPRAHSQTSTTSEEVTYAFCGRDSPNSGSPSEGYLSYPHETRICTDSELVPHTGNHQRGGRATPHVRVRYDVNMDTPGTDECKPLVTALARQALSTPMDQEMVSLLDRHYRPVKDTGEGSSDCQNDKKNYTDDFTVV